MDELQMIIESLTEYREAGDFESFTDMCEGYAIPEEERELFWGGQTDSIVVPGFEAAEEPPTSTAATDAGDNPVTDASEPQDDDDDDDDDDAQEAEAEPASKAEDKKKREHEEAEAKRKAEWDAKQQVKKEAEQQAFQAILNMTDDDIASASVKKLGDDTERLTRRNMKICVTDHIQNRCQSDSAFARAAMHPRKNMINCFKYINRHAKDFIEQELKDNDIKPSGIQGGDIPDDICYKWAEDYFLDMDAEEDKEKDEKFVPKPYNGRSTSSKKSKSKKTAAKPVEKTKPEKAPADTGQLSLMEMAG